MFASAALIAFMMARQAGPGPQSVDITVLGRNFPGNAMTQGTDANGNTTWSTDWINTGLPLTDLRGCRRMRFVVTQFWTKYREYRFTWCWDGTYQNRTDSVYWSDGAPDGSHGPNSNPMILLGSAPLTFRGGPAILTLH